MILLWLAAVPAVLAAVAVITLPGLPLAWTLGLRGLRLLAGGIAASAVTVAIATVAASILGISWSFLPVIGIAVVLAALGYGCARWLPAAPARTLRSRPHGAVLTLTALCIAGGILAFEIVRAIGMPDAVSQSYDAVFHLGATRHILSTGDASPLHMNLAVPHQEVVYYPTLWHASVALISQLSGASVPVATNAMAIAGAAWVWPVAICFFTLPFVAGERRALPLAAVFAATSSAFPYLLLTWGVLYPNFLSSALLPITLGFFHLALRPQISRMPTPAHWIAALGALVAVVAAHPNGLFGTAVLSLPLLFAVANDIRRSDLPAGRKWLRWSALLLATLGCVALWLTISTSDNDKQYSSNFMKGVFGAILNAPMVPGKSLFTPLFIIAGVAILIVARRHRWLVASYGLAVAFYAIAVGTTGPMRTLLTGAWYNDAARLAALLPIAAVPLATVAAAFLLRLVSAGATQLATQHSLLRDRPRLLRTLTLAAVVLMLFAGARGSNMGAQIGWMSELYSESPANGDPGLLSTDERALLDRLAAEVPVETRIAGDPWNGAAFAYGISGRSVLFPHMTAQYDTDAAVIAASLRDLGAAACPYLERLGVGYILDFGDPNFDTYPAEKSAHFAGLRDVGANPVLEEIDREGEATLYRVACPAQ